MQQGTSIDVRLVAAFEGIAAWLARFEAPAIRRIMSDAERAAAPAAFDALNRAMHVGECPQVKARY